MNEYRNDSEGAGGRRLRNSLTYGEQEMSTGGGRGRRGRRNKNMQTSRLAFFVPGTALSHRCERKLRHHPLGQHDVLQGSPRIPA